MQIALHFYKVLFLKTQLLNTCDTLRSLHAFIVRTPVEIPLDIGERPLSEPLQPVDRVQHSRVPRGVTPVQLVQLAVLLRQPTTAIPVLIGLDAVKTFVFRF